MGISFGIIFMDGEFARIPEIALLTSSGGPIPFLCREEWMCAPQQLTLPFGTTHVVRGIGRESFVQ